MFLAIAGRTVRMDVHEFGIVDATCPRSPEAMPQERCRPSGAQCEYIQNQRRERRHDWLTRGEHITRIPSLPWRVLTSPPLVRNRSAGLTLYPAQQSARHAAVERGKLDVRQHLALSIQASCSRTREARTSPCLPSFCPCHPEPVNSGQPRICHEELFTRR